MVPAAQNRRIAMSAEEFHRYDSMKLFLHQIYEFRKGVRNLVLCTMCRTCASLLAERLEHQGIGYLIQEVAGSKVNLYFGNRRCLDAVATFINRSTGSRPRRISCSAPCSATTSRDSANATASVSGNRHRNPGIRTQVPDADIHTPRREERSVRRSLSRTTKRPRSDSLRGRFLAPIRGYPR